MKVVEFKITKGEYIQLTQLIKAVSISSNGAEAGAMVMDGIVTLNGRREDRKRAKVRAGDTVEVLGHTIIVK